MLNPEQYALFEQIPAVKLLGIRPIRSENANVLFEMNVEPEHMNLIGTLHAGITCTLADSAMFCAVYSKLNPGETHTTIEFKINLLKAVKTGKLRAIGRVIRKGRTIALAESDVADEHGDLVAKALSTCLIMKKAK